MSFGLNYTNKYLFDFQEWNKEDLREWLSLSSRELRSLSGIVLRGGDHTILMVYTPVCDYEQNSLSGYFIPNSELATYLQEGWVFIPNQSISEIMI